MPKQTLQDLIAEGKIKNVIAQLRERTATDKDLQEQVLQLAARFATYEQQLHGKTSDSNTLATERNQINAAALYVIEQLKEDATLPENKVDNATIIQNADKIYNINHIDNANFS